MAGLLQRGCRRSTLSEEVEVVDGAWLPWLESVRDADGGRLEVAVGGGGWSFRGSLRLWRVVVGEMKEEDNAC
ncbi:acetoin utilization protein AcuC [Sesbania bispinosa]|nr:acetoin utilization protein AcuC [Sesbania bispinosa]